MLKTMREGGAYFIKGVMVVVVLTFLGTIFVVWGMKSTPGEMMRRGVIATVGDVEITQEEYQQALRRQIDMYKQLFGDRLDEKMLESLNVKRAVADRLIRRQIVLRYAAQRGLEVGTEEVVDSIRQIPAFAGKEGFTRQRYLDVLKANRLTPAWFETQVRLDLTERKVEDLVRESVKVSETELREAFRQARRKLTVEVVQLPAGEDGKKLADQITVARAKEVPLAAAAKDAGASVKTIGPFSMAVPPQDIPDPQPFLQAASILKVGETSPLVAGAKASYLLRLVSQEDPSPEEFEKERATFQLQFLGMKREMVLADWLREVGKTVAVRLEMEGL
ncbi:MAG: SurA N-terminal domain-containing protein [candidate division NC10 bacterium]|nr:SurA N-terminal domain-containing protein [candidate division NC10 bacterium]